MTHIAGHDLFLGVDNGRWASGCIDANARTYRADFRSAFRPYNGAYLYRLDEHCRGGPTGSAYNAGRRDRLQSGLGSHRCNHVSHGVCLADRAADQRTIAKVHQAATPEEARAAIADRLPSLVASVLTPADLDRVHSTLSKVTTAKTRAGLKREDWLGAAAVFVLVFGSTMPILVPFLLVQDARTALRISNSIAIAIMLIAGYAFGHLVEYRPWWTAGSMVLLGCLLVALTIALGG
ncbi:MAG: hypothetical protein E5Y86_08160 [Mesorhizobium sp.]|nr:MAG: hypothetical protein E5Y86_08160 [Mesorhizobium sp.]